MNDAAMATAIFPFRQPQERESTIRSRARSGPATTPPRRQIPLDPPRENTRATIDHRGAKQPAPAGRSLDRPQLREEERASEQRDRHPKAHGHQPRTGQQLREEEQAPEQRDRHQQAHRTIPNRGTKPRISRLPEPQRSTAEQIGKSPLRTGVASTSAGGSIPAHAGREHNEEVDRAINSEHRRTPEQLGDTTTLCATRPKTVEHPRATGDTPEPTTPE